MDRRQAIKTLGIGLTAVRMSRFAYTATVMPKALVFDTFGTVVDWRGSIIEEGKAYARTKGFELDWGDFADRWRAGYAPAMDKVRKGQMPWTNLDTLHRMILDQIMMEFRMLPPMSEAEKQNWVH